ncbi:Fc receptor-like protein 5 isoform X2 [Sebastes umbrosus]|uniref:Fc receptor-like protein 5 isoform X2 n=1 Tax=Sebastes umbrosus TaxID=72105 RepID=UPI00189E5039|nr:Fc receptor-like protein 5 isoform X2 [Sebastes umbrosus]
MDTLISLLVLSTLPQLAVPVVPLVTSFRAVVELVSGDSRIFSGEGARLKCSVADAHKSSWDYLWFRGSEQLSQTGEHLVLWQPKVQESGKYYCQGVRDTAVGNIHTLQSLPLEINVDGGWAILQVPPHPGLVGNTLEFTCRVRGTPPLHEVILYKDGLEVMRQSGLIPHFYLTNLTLEDQGMYSCRASWDVQRRTRSVISATASVHVSEVLSLPVLEIVADNDLMPVNKMKLICLLEYNAPAPAPPIHYYFYKNNNRLGTATTKNHDLVKRTPGHYSCKAKVPELGVSRWSEPKPFGEVTGPQTMVSPTLPPRDPWPLAPPVASPELSLPTAPEPTVSIQSSNPPLMPSQQAPRTLLSTVQSLYPTATPFSMSGQSGDMPDELVDMSGESGDMPDELVDMSGESGDMPDELVDMSGESGDMPDELVDMSGESGDMPDELVDMSGESGDMPDELVDMSGESGDMPEESGDMSGESGDMPEVSGDM